jgi:uncharacterized protein (TIGR02147 family)
MQDKNVFHHTDYKEYLNTVFSPSGEGRGQRSLLAKAIGVHSAFVSQVLKQKVHFSLEHALRISHFLQHTEHESRYFLLMIEYGRAGSKDLRAFYKKQMEEIQEKRMQITERLQVKQTLTQADQLIYYSAWYYGAIHILLSIPSFQSKEKLTQYLRMDAKKISECLEFLCACGLAQEKEGRYTIGTTRLHLPANSPLISKHHTNWRMRAIQALENASSQESLHYSSAITLSRNDVLKIRKVLLSAVEQTENIYKPSKEEVAFVFNVDFFPL